MARHNNIDYSPNIEISFANISVGNETVSLQDKQKHEVKNLKRDGYPVGTPVGAPAIANILKSKYHENALSERTISRLISDVKFRGLEESYLPSEVSGATRSYVARLSLVKESLMKGHGLSALEAGLTDRVLQEFDDPHGDRVDLISQFSILWELAEREISSDPTQDLEDLFSFAPWNDDSALYKAAIESGVAEPPKLRLIMPMIFDNDDVLVRLCVGAFAQLNLPFLYHAFDVSTETIAYVWRNYQGIHAMQSAVGDDRKVETLGKYCNWRVLTESYLRGLQVVFLKPDSRFW